MNYDFSKQPEGKELQMVVFNVCQDIEKILEWSLVDCQKRTRRQSKAVGRALRFKTKVKNICRRLIDRLWKYIYQNDV